MCINNTNWLISFYLHNDNILAEFRYEAVAVIHKDLKLDSLKDLKGLNSCHTGVGRNVGYKVPLTKLKNMGIIGKLNEPDLSPRENELKAFSTLFSKACIVGKWSPDPKINQKLSKFCIHYLKSVTINNFTHWQKKHIQTFVNFVNIPTFVTTPTISLATMEPYDVWPIMAVKWPGLKLFTSENSLV